MYKVRIALQATFFFFCYDNRYVTPKYPLAQKNDVQKSSFAITI